MFFKGLLPIVLLAVLSQATTQDEHAGPFTEVQLEQLKQARPEVLARAESPQDYQELKEQLALQSQGGRPGAGMIIPPQGGLRDVPENDLCPDAIPVLLGSSYAFDTSEATRTQSVSNCGTFGTNGYAAEVWYSFTAPASGSAQFTVLDADYDVMLALYEACFSNRLYCGYTESFSYNVIEGFTYTLLITGYLTSTGSGVLEVSMNGVTAANDDCANAIELEGPAGGQVYSTLLATPGEDAGCGDNALSPDLWYSWTAPCDTDIRLEICDVRNYDTVLALYPDCGGQPLACNDDFDLMNCGYGSRIDWTALAGESYWIQVSGFDGTAGSGMLNWSTTPLPNQSPGEALPLELDQPMPFCTALAGIYNLQNPCTGHDSPNLWYSYTADCAAERVFSLCDGADFNTTLSLWTPGLDPIACNDDFCGDLSQIPYVMQDGETVLIQVAGYLGESGSGTLRVTGTCPPPDNNTCETAEMIEVDGTGFRNFNTSYATPSVVPTCAAEATPDVWYAFSSACDAEVRFTACSGTGYDLLLAAYASCGGAELACSDQACPQPSGFCEDAPCAESAELFLQLTANETVWIQATGSQPAGGEGILTWELLDPPANDTPGVALEIDDQGNWDFCTARAGASGYNSVCSDSGTPDLWYRYTANCDGLKAFRICDTADFDAVLGLFDSGAVYPLTCDLLSCDPGPQILWNMNAGESVLVQVTGFNGESGSGILEVAAACPPPANDLCENAELLDGSIGTVVFDTRNATHTLAPPCAAGSAPDTWYQWAAGRCETTITFSTCADHDFDTVLSAWNACGDSLLACNDNACDEGSELSLSLAPYDTVRVQVSGVADQRGTGFLTWSVEEIPDNDQPQHATALADSGSIAFCTAYASSSGLESCRPASQDVWFMYQAPCSGTATFSTCDDANYDTVIAVWSEDLQELLSCNDDACPDWRSRTSLFLRDGETVLVQAGGFDMNRSGSAVLDYGIECLPPPENDFCGEALPLSGASGSIAFTNYSATAEQQPSCSIYPTNEVWYTWTADCPSRVVFETCSSGSFDTILAAYEECGSAPLACNDDAPDCSILGSRITLDVAGGETVLLQVGGWNSSFGSGTLSWAVQAPGETPQEALPITGGGAWPYCTDSAQPDVLMPCVPGSPKDLWFLYTAECDGLQTFSTCGSAGYDTALALWSLAEEPLDCNDDYCGTQSSLSRTMLAGQSVFVQVGGYGSASGEGVLQVQTPCSAPYNDACDTALPVSGAVPLEIPLSTLNAGNSTPPEDGGCGIGQDVWYTGVPSVSGILELGVGSSEFTIALSVYEGACPDSLALLACGVSEAQGPLALPVCAGQVYTFRIGSLDGTSGGGSLFLDLLGNEGITPKAPQNLQIQLTEDMFGRPFASLQWDPVNESIEGCAIEDVHYRLEILDENGSTFLQAEMDSTSVNFIGMGSEREVRLFQVEAFLPEAPLALARVETLGNKPAASADRPGFRMGALPVIREVSGSLPLAPTDRQKTNINPLPEQPKKTVGNSR